MVTELNSYRDLLWAFYCNSPLLLCVLWQFWILYWSWNSRVRSVILGRQELSLAKESICFFEAIDV